MSKQTIVLSFMLVALLFATTLASTVPNTIVESVVAAPFNLLLNPNKKSLSSPSATNVCCLPQIYSIKSTYTSIVPTHTGTLKAADGGVNFFGDYKSGKIYQKLFFNATDTDVTEFWDIKVSDRLTLQYASHNGLCTCKKLENVKLWAPQCIPLESGGVVSKAKIGNYDALKITSQTIGATAQTWTFREPQMSLDKCWILSYATNSQHASQSIVYFDMTEKVDPNIFLVPSICPTVDKCL